MSKKKETRNSSHEKNRILQAKELLTIPKLLVETLRVKKRQDFGDVIATGMKIHYKFEVKCNIVVKTCKFI